MDQGKAMWHGGAAIQTHTHTMADRATNIDADLVSEEGTPKKANRTHIEQGVR